MSQTISRRSLAVIAVAACVVSISAGVYYLLSLRVPIELRGPGRTISLPRPCENCTVAFTKVVWIGQPSDPLLIGDDPVIARSEQGEFFVTSADRTQVIEYDSDGRFLRVTGHKGDGPGEYQRIDRLLPLGADTVVAWDAGGRVIAFKSTTGRVVTDERSALARLPCWARVGAGIFLCVGRIYGSGADRSPSSCVRQGHLVASRLETLILTPANVSCAQRSLRSIHQIRMPGRLRHSTTCSKNGRWAVCH